MLDEWGIAQPQLGLGFVWPSQVRDYFQMWSPYVEGTVAALKSCAGATADAGLSKQMKTNAYFLESSWHAYDHYDAYDFTNNAPVILSNLQQAIYMAGTFTQQAKPNCPSVAWPAAAPLDHQSWVISALQDAGYVVAGQLDLLEAVADGEIVAAGEVAQKVGQKLGGLADVFATPWPWIAITAIGGAVIVYSVWPRRRSE
jgi:hypothetical protein